MSINNESILELIKLIPEITAEKRTIIVLVDGLGLNDLKLPFPSVKRVYKTVFPSTTPAFLYTLHSLKPPREHGFIEWYMRFDELGQPIMIPPWKTISKEELRLGSDIDRNDVFPYRSLSEILDKMGVSTCYYTPYSESAFTKATSRRAKVIRARYFSQVFPLDDADFILIYWPAIDQILHERYVDEAFNVEVDALERYIGLLWKKARSDTRLYIFSDHGLTRINRKYLLPIIEGGYPVGGSRVAFYRDVDLEKVREELNKRRLPADTYRLEELEEFRGRINRRCYENYGETVVVARKGVGFKYPFEKRSLYDKGAHGGRSREELYVNVWVAEK